MHPPELVNLTWAATGRAVHQHRQQYLRKVCVPKGSWGVCAHSLLWTGKNPHLFTKNSDQISSKHLLLHQVLLLSNNASVTQMSWVAWGLVPYQEGHLACSELQTTYNGNCTEWKITTNFLGLGKKSNPSFYFLITVNISSSATLWSEHCEHPLAQG